MTKEEELKNPLLELDNLADEEIKTPTPETEEDNSKDDQEPKEEKEETTEEVTEETEEESKEQSEEETETKPEEKKTSKKPTAKQKRHAEQEEGRLAEVTRLRGMVIDAEVQKAEADWTSLIDLAKKDPKLADEVAMKFGYTDYRDAKKFLSPWDVVTEKTRNDDDKEDYFQERLAEVNHDQSLLDAQAILDQLPEELQDEAIDEFNELIDGKVLTKATAIKYAKMVTLSLKKEEVETTDNSKNIKKLSSTGISTTKKPAKEWLVEVIVDGKIVLLDPKLLK